MALKQTPFHPFHLELGAKMVPFAGYEMPIQYSGVIEEHRCVRSGAGLFDLSHMGEIELRGEGVPAFLDRLLTNRFTDLPVGRARYTAMCREDGGILDDLIVYRLQDRHLLVVNAANFEGDLAWIRAHASAGVEVLDVNQGTALAALQGPRAEALVQRLTDAPLETLPYYGVVETEVAARPAVVARTGYTGEDGFEIYLAAEHAAALWRAITDLGEGEGLRPIGLAARDTLRLEMKYALYGNEIDESTTPLEAGLAWIVKLDKEFIGANALRARKEAGIGRRLVAFEIEGRGIPRPGHRIAVAGEGVGAVTSGTFSPSLSRGIGLGYVNRPHTRPGTALEIEVRGRLLGARIIKPPFYKTGSLRAA